MTLRVIFTIIVSFFVLGGGGYAGYTYFTKPKPQVFVECPKDVKQCAAGLTVGRVLPRCEFALCPEERPKGSGGITVSLPDKVEGPFTGSLDDLRAKGGDYICTFLLSTGPLSGFAGTSSISQGEARVDLAPSSESGILYQKSTHLLVTRTTVGEWKDGAKKGATYPSLSENSTAFRPDQSYVFDCKAWTRDPAALTLPTGVTFTAPPPVAQ